MATINKKKTIHNSNTYEGAKATIPNAEEQLKRTIMACMLWEDNFYEDGESIADRIEKLSAFVSEEKLNDIAIKAKYDQKIRHAPLLLAVGMARRGCLKSDVLEKLIRRPDELSEFLALYWKDGKCPISSQVKKGLAKAFNKFDEYQLAKWNRDKEIKLKDVLFLCHAKPKNKEQEELWKRLINYTLRTPDTWEVELSSSKDKKESWNRLVKENRLGAQAYLMNLKNMLDSGIDKNTVLKGFDNLNFRNVLPFQFINAARYNPGIEAELDDIFLRSFNDQNKLSGKSIIIIDISGSMGAILSSRSNLSRKDVACSFASITREICEESSIYATAGDYFRRKHATKQVPNRHGFALIDAIKNMNSEIGGGGIFIKQVLDYIYNIDKSADRIIIITDEQDCDIVHSATTANYFGKYNYIVNVGSYDRGVGYGAKTVHISGWSEKVINYIKEYELNK